MLAQCYGTVLLRKQEVLVRTKLLVARPGKEKEQLSYPAQYEAVWRAFAAAGIHSVKKTHAMRGCGVRSGELHGVDEEQASPSLYFALLEQRYDELTAGHQRQAYLSHLPKYYRGVRHKGSHKVFRGGFRGQECLAGMDVVVAYIVRSVHTINL